MSKVRLGDVAEERKETCKQNVDDYPIVGLEHLIPEEITLTEWSEGVENTFSKLFREGDVLFGRRRAYLKKAAVAPFDGICSGDITVIKPIKGKIRPELLPFVIQNDTFFDFAVGKSAGSLSPRVKWESLKNYEFELPNWEEQKELAKVLWAMDATKRSYQKLLQKTDELVKAQFIEMFGDPKTNNRRLPTIKGEDAFVFTSGKANTIQNLNDSYEYVCYGGNGITGYSKEYFCERSTLVIGRVGEYCGSVHLTKPRSWITDNAIYIKEFRTDSFVLEFLYFEFLLLDFHRFANTVGQPKITQAPLASLLYIAPTIDEQKWFVQFMKESDESKSGLNKTFVEFSAKYSKVLTDNLG